MHSVESTEVLGHKVKYYHLFNGLLCLLAVLHAYWFSLISKVGSQIRFKVQGLMCDCSLPHVQGGQVEWAQHLRQFLHDRPPVKAVRRHLLLVFVLADTRWQTLSAWQDAAVV